ncbi:29575_t:CDS:2 [Gigaspora margarita]|uniref:29575_t:CDS:1 n=1 Tax=Gigaspora margarita TaxID=4874 RepID=A0ABN7W3G5_GIGMA|nr:29575_t:CDS:2 [Gigaspora margarita]
MSAVGSKSSNETFLYIFAFPDKNYGCPMSDYSQYIIYSQFIDQAGHIVSYGGTLFTVAVYGLQSQFGWRNTFFLDDFFILTFSISPIIPFYEKHLPKIRGLILYILLFFALSITSYDIFEAKDGFSQETWAQFLNLQSLNLFLDAVNLALIIYLIYYYHILKSGGIPRRIFFITLFVLQIKLFFSYAYLCTLPIVDSFFDFILGIILSRTIASFFSKDDFEDFLMEVQDKNSKVIESFESIRIQHDEDDVVKDFETVAISENEKDDDEIIPIPTKVGIFKKLIAIFFFLNVENGKLVYKIDKVKYLGAQHLNIKESIDIYVEHGFLKIETGQITYIGKNHVKRSINLTDHWPLKIEYDKVYVESPTGQSFIDLTGHRFFEINRGKIMHMENDRIKEVIDITNHGLLKIVNFDTGFKVIYMKTPTATRFIDLTEYGLLNYIVYGHRRRNDIFDF